MDRPMVTKIKCCLFFLKSTLGICIRMHSQASLFSGSQNHEIIKVTHCYPKIKYSQFLLQQSYMTLQKKRKKSSLGHLEMVSVDHAENIAVRCGSILSLIPTSSTHVGILLVRVAQTLVSFTNENNSPTHKVLFLH